MLYSLSQYLLKISAGTDWENALSFLRLFRYITFRSGGAALTALVFSWWLGPKVIAWLKRLKFGQNYSDKAEAAGGLASRVESEGLRFDPPPLVKGPPSLCREDGPLDVGTCGVRLPGCSRAG